MRKSTFLKLALSIVAIFLILGANAQSTAVEGTPAVTFLTTGTTYMVEGTTIPVYALPDTYYHPSYAPQTANSLTAGFTWTWLEATTTLTFHQNNVEDNYVRISAPALSAAGSPYTVNVLEKAPALYGGCDDGAGENITINVVAAPAVSFGAADVVVNLCAGDLTLPTTIPATITGGWQNYRLAWNLEIATLNAALAKDFYYDDETGALPTAPQKYAVNHQTDATFAVATSGVNELMTVGSFLSISNKTTVYTYTVVSVNDQASRFGNFIALNGVSTTPAAFTYYAAPAAGNTYTVTVYPAPNTGPIYHIPAAWGV